MLSNAIRGHMAELGIVSAKGRNGTAELLAILANEQDDRIPIAAHFSLDVLARQYAVLTTEIGAIEKRIHAWHRSRPTAAGDSWGGSNRGHGLGVNANLMVGFSEIRPIANQIAVCGKITRKIHHRNRIMRSKREPIAATATGPSR